MYNNGEITFENMTFGHLNVKKATTIDDEETCMKHYLFKDLTIKI